MNDSGCPCLPPMGPTDAGGVLYWDGERWNASGPPPGEGAVLTWGTNGPFWANPAGAVVPAGGLEKGPKPRLKDEEQPM